MRNPRDTETKQTQSCPLEIPRHTEQSSQQARGFMLGIQAGQGGLHRGGDEQDSEGREKRGCSEPGDRPGHSSRLVHRAHTEGTT